MFRLKLLTVVVWLVLFSQVPLCGQSLEKVPMPSGSSVFASSVNTAGNLLIFQTNTNPYKAWQLQASAYRDGRWQKPEPLISVNDYGEVPASGNNFQGDFIGTPSLNASGDTLYFAATFKSGLGGKDLFYSVRQNDVWSAPINLGSRINTSGGEESPSVSADGHSLYFTRRSGQDACYTIFCSTKDPRGEWGKPVALPAPVNQGCEKGPRILADNITLVFSSQREGSHGMDLYVSVRSITGAWTSAKRVAALSTTGADGYVTMDASGNSVYFSVVNGNTGALYRCSPVPALLSLQRSQILACTLTDSITGKPLSGQVKLSLEGDKPELLEHQRNITHFTKRLYGEATFRITAEADGYPRKSWIIRPGYDSDSLVMALRLPPQSTFHYVAATASQTQRALFNGDSVAHVAAADPAAAGSAMSASTATGHDKTDTGYKPGHCSIMFATGEHTLSPEMQTALLTLVAYARLHREGLVEITGYTDDVGDEAFNIGLSALRSESIKKYFIEMGVHENQIVTHAVGESQPLVSNSSDTNRAKNRRALVRLK